MQQIFIQKICLTRIVGCLVIKEAGVVDFYEINRVDKSNQVDCTDMYKTIFI